MWLLCRGFEFQPNIIGQGYGRKRQHQQQQQQSYQQYQQRVVAKAFDGQLFSLPR